MAAHVLNRSLIPEIADKVEDGARAITLRIRTGRFQRWLALVAGLSSALTGTEVGYLHYRGSYSRRVMYTPVILSAALFGAGIWAFRSRRAACSVLPAVSSLALVDSIVGSYFHVRGIQRKPGGWRLPLNNIMMGPPIFAPLLFSTSAYLGLIASFLERDDSPDRLSFSSKRPWLSRFIPKPGQLRWERELSEGRFQKHLAVVTAVSALCSGTEALYSHYKNNFRYKAQWTPVVVAPLLVATSAGAVISPRIARTWLPAMSSAAMLNGAVGFGYHARGVVRRPGGSKMIFYNIIHGPPVLAPLLFAAAGFMGLLASLMRREEA
ncbi:MAG TPA: hypothetical protein VJ728_07930 [Candidatus Binataceae bacterium]|nr:hypothetical protein [Candidatus Binataceae bacterium]